MSLPMHGVMSPAMPKLQRFSMPNSGSPATLESFSKYGQEISKGFNPYAEVDIKDIKTEKVKVTVHENGEQKEVVKEMAVCPECGSVSCACLARVTLQQRVDEENAQGVRHAKQPDPMAILAQPFNQMTHNAGLNGSSARSFF